MFLSMGHFKMFKPDRKAFKKKKYQWKKKVSETHLSITWCEDGDHCNENSESILLGGTLWTSTLGSIL